MKKYFLSTMFLGLILALTPWYAQAQTISELLPLDGLNFFVNYDGSPAGAPDGYEVSYDPATQTISYVYPETESGYGYAGWDFRSGDLLNLSAFSALTVQLTASDFVDNTSIEFAVRYSGMDSDTKFNVESAANGPVTITMALDPSLKSAVEYIYIKSSKAGKLKIDKLSASQEGQLDLSFDEFNPGWHGNATYEYNSDLDLGIISFNGTGSGDNWIPWGWGNEGRNFGEYDYFELDFAEACSTDITIEISYNPENQYPQSIITAPAGSDFVALALNKDVPSEYLRPDNGELGGGIRDIVIRAQGNEPSILLVKRAYMAKGEVPVIPPVPYPDLIVTDITWDPANPVDGDQLNFAAKVENIGTLASPDGVKHGVVFHIYDANETEITATWSDNYFSSIAPGEAAWLKVKDVNATGENGEGTGNLWTYWTAGGPYYVQAQVNDTGDFTELDRSNNWSDFFEIKDLGTGIQSPSVQGNVYVENGILKLKGYSPSATATVYNVQGQEQKNDYLMNGIYIVKVIDNGNTSIHKVVAK